MSVERLTPALQEAIENSGLSLKALAERAEMDIGQLSRFMRNERTITLPAAGRLCAVLGLELKPQKREGK
jgi:transcriptional regulator with XRE-family HTH domain